MNSLYMNIAWYDLSPKDRKILLIMMNQRTPILMAGGIYPLTYEGYKDINCNIYSQCTALQALIDTFK